MTRLFFFGMLYVLGIVCGGDVVWSHPENPLSLTYLGRVDLRDHGQGPKEPSGVTRGPSVNGRFQLWIVSDDSKMLYTFVEDNHQEKNPTFSLAHQHSLPIKGLEGITMNSSGQALVVKEETNTLVRVSQDTFEEVERVRLAHMAGFEELAQHFVDSEKNKGLEGITWNSKSETFFVVKEGRPSMLLEIRNDLQGILNHWILVAEQEFTISGLPQERLDLSGLCYDSHRDKLWLVSDKGQHLFLYNYHTHMVEQRIPLGYRKNKKGIGAYREIVKAEGVTISEDGATLYVVSDKEARLYVYAIRE